MYSKSNGGYNFSSRKKKEPSISCSRPLAIAWSLIPGGGSLYCGDYQSGVIQMLGFSTAIFLNNYFTNQSDFISEKKLTVRFSAKDAIISENLRQSGYLYTDKSIFNQSDSIIFQYSLYNFSDSNDVLNPRTPIIGESLLERDLRLLKRNRIYEINPLIEYGGKNYEYTQLNKTTFMAGNFGVMAILAVPYSIYSGYRASGGGANKDKDSNSFDKIAVAPFTSKYLFDWKVGLSIVISAVMIHNIENISPIFYRPLVASPGTFDTASLGSSYLANTMVAVGEETFFRGMINYEMIRALGPTAGIIGSSTLFAANHTWQGYKNISPQFIAGIAFGTLHYVSGFDLGYPIAAHFWANVIGTLYAIKQVETSELVGKNQQEIHFMPIVYTEKF